MEQLKHFRRWTGGRAHDRSRPPVALRDKLVVGAVVINLLILGFGAGGAYLWAQYTALFWSGAALFLLLMPDELGGNTQRGRWVGAPLRRLLSFPVFWSGVALLTYVWIQSWNLRFHHHTTSTGRIVLLLLEDIPWLPRGMNGPLNEDNPFRFMLLVLVPWLNACLLWAGLQTRRAVSFLLHALAVFVLCYAVLALYQHWAGYTKILGLWPTAASKEQAYIPFWGTLVNENHGANFILLGVGLSLGLFLSGFVHGARQMRMGGPYLLHLCAALIMSVSIVRTQARGSIVLLAALWLVFLVASCVFFYQHFRARGLLLPVGLLVIFGVYMGSLLANPQIFENLKLEYEKTMSLKENPELEARYYLNQIGMDMIQMYPWLGWGAGTYRYTHVGFSANYPEFHQKRYGARFRVWDAQQGKMVTRRKITLYSKAHNDWIDLMVALGVVGCLPVAFKLGWVGWILARGRRAIDHGVWVGLAGILALMVGALWEFHLQMPLVLGGFVAILVTILKLVDLQARVARVSAASPPPPAVTTLPP
jgi:O-antigen ligase